VEYQPVVLPYRNGVVSGAHAKDAGRHVQVISELGSRWNGHLKVIGWFWHGEEVFPVFFVYYSGWPLAPSCRVQIMAFYRRGMRGIVADYVSGNQRPR